MTARDVPPAARLERSANHAALLDAARRACAAAVGVEGRADRMRVADACLADVPDVTGYQRFAFEVWARTGWPLKALLTALSMPSFGGDAVPPEDAR